MIAEFVVTPDRIQTFLIIMGFISMLAIPSILEHKPNKKQLHR